MTGWENAVEEVDVQMVLRDLDLKDAEYMLEWMHDENVNGYLGKDFSQMEMEDCLSFIRDSHSDEKNKHFAIADDGDEYMGTISLKNIDMENKRAEYAISCRSKAMGKGFARKATERLFEIGKESYGLALLYLNVYDYNVRAQRLYEKTGFRRVGQPEYVREAQDERLLWYEREL